MRTTILVLLALVAFGRCATAQQAGPHVTGLAGISAGDGGSAAAGGAAVGWTTSRNLGFEVEIAWAPDLDFTRDIDVPRIASVPSIFPELPEPSFESTGRLLTFQTNALISTGWRERWNMTAIAGGGVANERRKTKIGIPSIVFPTNIFGSDIFPLPFDYTWIEREVTSSSSALCLNVGGRVEYQVTRRIGAGVDARYVHAFFGEEGLHTARVAGLVGWRF